MIDEDRTMQLFGYTSAELTFSSNKKMVAVCEGCGKYRVTTPNAYKVLCRQCKFDDPITKEKMMIASRRPRGAMPEEQKQNISKALKGKKRPPCSQEWCNNISKATLGKKHTPWTEERKRKLSARNQGISYEDWNGFSTDEWRDWTSVDYVNRPFKECHRHHITRTIVVCIPADLHNHIQHNLKTGENMGEINVLAIQYINGGL